MSVQIGGDCRYVQMPDHPEEVYSDFELVILRHLSSIVYDSLIILQQGKYVQAVTGGVVINGTGGMSELVMTCDIGACPYILQCGSENRIDDPPLLLCVIPPSIEDKVTISLSPWKYSINDHLCNGLMIYGDIEWWDKNNCPIIRRQMFSSSSKDEPEESVKLDFLDPNGWEW